jgi:hypothetical protein
MTGDPAVSLQFDHAEPAGPAPGAAGDLACARCTRPIGTSYFDVNGAVACPACRTVLESERRRGGAGRLLAAGALGLVAAALGSALYYAVAALTGYEFGLIGIVVGLGVGAAVRAGARGRGGWVYQTTAMALTYLAIVSTYVPPLVKELAAREAPAATAPASADATAGDAAAPASGATAVESDAAPDAGVAETAPGAGGAALALLVFAGIVLALPFLAGFENVMGIAIIGFALYEAWKLNRAAPFVVTGPLDARLRGGLPGAGGIR